MPLDPRSSAGRKGAHRRARELGGDTVEFEAVDYRPPTTGATDVGEVPSDVSSRLGEATSPRSLSVGGGSADDGKMPRRAIAVIAIAALAVFAIAFALIRGAFVSLEESSRSADGASGAVDAYSLFAVTGEDGGLDVAYLAYVDSINERAEFRRLPGALVLDAAGDATLAGVFASTGLGGLSDRVSAFSDVSISAAVQLAASEMEEVLGLAASGDGARDPSGIASSLMSRSQLVSETSLRGLLRTLRDIGPDGVIVLGCPTLPTDPGPSLDQGAWTTAARGMRDPTV